MALESSLGASNLAELESAVDQMGQDIHSWKESELRLWGRIVRWSYRLLNWKGAYQSFVAAMRGPDQAAESFFNDGIDRWGREGRLAPAEAAGLDIDLLGKTPAKQFPSGSGSAAVEGDNIHNLAVMLLSVIPGLGAIAYLASRPLRRKLLVRLMLDQAAWKLPFKLYGRMRLGQILALSVQNVGITDNQRRNVAKLSTG